MFTKLIKLHNDAYLKNQILTHNNKSEINNTFIFSHEMSIGLIYRPLNRTYPTVLFSRPWVNRMQDYGLKTCKQVRNYPKMS